jgi:hypothetical protein
MPRAKRSRETATTIDGFSLIWNLHREQQWCTADECKGIAIRVRVAVGARRELFLEYQPVRSRKAGYTRVDAAQPAILAAKVEAHIREAMANGWNPESRGKPYFYQVEELPG